MLAIGKSAMEFASRVMTVSPDVATSTNLTGFVNNVGALAAVICAIDLTYVYVRIARCVRARDNRRYFKEKSSAYIASIALQTYWSYPILYIGYVHEQVVHISSRTAC